MSAAGGSTSSAPASSAATRRSAPRAWRRPDCCSTGARSARPPTVSACWWCAWPQRRAATRSARSDLGLLRGGDGLLQVRNLRDSLVGSGHGLAVDANRRSSGDLGVAGGLSGLLEPFDEPVLHHARLDGLTADPGLRQLVDECR